MATKLNQYLVRYLYNALVTIVSIFLVSISFASTSFASTIPPLGFNPNFSTIPIKTEESVGEIIGITKDHKGFVWVAGSAGIARYDGYRFHTYPAESNEIGQAYINDVFEDAYDELWIASADNGVARLNRDLDTFQVYDLSGELQGRRVEKIYQDEQNNLWFTGAGGVVLYDRAHDIMKNVLANSTLKYRIAVDMIQVSKDEYLLATREGVVLWHRDTDQLEYFSPDSSAPNSLPNSVVRAFAKDAQGEIWVGHDQGLCRFDQATKTFEAVNIAHAIKDRKGVSIWRMRRDKQGIIWLGTDGNGLMYFNPVTREVGGYTQSVLPSSLGASVVRSVYEDDLGDLWIGGYPAGLFHYNKSNNFFSIYSNFIRDKNDVYQNHVWSFAEDGKGNLWLGIDSLGIVYFDRQNNSFSRMYNGLDLANAGLPHSVLSLLLDSKGNLWSGSWAQGVSRINLSTKAITHFNPNGSNGSKFVAESVWNIMEAKNGDIYFSSMNNGLIRYRSDSDTFVNYRADKKTSHSISDNSVWSSLEASDGRIWVATFGGLNIFNPNSETFDTYANDSLDPYSLSSNRVRSFLEDSKSRLWVATLGGGLNAFSAATGKFTHIGRADGLGSDDVIAIQEDNNHLLWISTTKGITSFNSETKELQNYTYKNWLQNGEFSHNSILKLSSGEIAFGGVKGFNILRPNEVTSNTFIPPVYLTELVVLNTPIKASEKNSVIDRDILEAKHIQLTHNDSMISLTFSALNYRVYDDNRYKYKLKGFDHDWHVIPDNNKAIYTRLDAGTYTFSVMASNNNGVWTKETDLVEITVLPAPWLTWWAYALYFGVSIYLVTWYVISQKRKIENAKALNEKLVELDQLKDNFMANTSHELRTPLNGILGIAEALHGGSSGPLSKTTLENIEIIISCGRRLERMVNNILDFSKTKTGDVELNLGCESINNILEEIIPECLSAASSNTVKVSKEIPNNSAPIYCDLIRTKHIFYNLISNALKYTENGSITVTARDDQRYIYVCVKDTGMGIAEEQLSQLFSSFTQLSESGIHTKSGTGLGLAMTKYFVEAQGGLLVVDSELGVGSSFTVSLPKATPAQMSASPVTHYKQRQAITGISKNSAAYESKQGKDLLQVTFPKNYFEGSDSGTILVVDDEIVNRMVLKEMMLKQNFIVYEAVNGQEVIDAFSYGFMCDLILLDIMMPKLSGIDTCVEIRKKYSALELPIIFVSAKTQAGDIVECFHVHGNDFVSKPVNKDELLVRINAQLECATVYRDLKKCV